MTLRAAQRGTDDLHRLEIHEPGQWADAAAARIAETVMAVTARRGRCLLGLSGGGTPQPVFEALTRSPIDWDRVVVLQVDERIAAAGSPERNLTSQEAVFADLPGAWLPLPVDELLDEWADGDGPETDAPLAPIAATSPAVAAFVDALRTFADDPPILDVVHLGLGTDGHTASLFPDDPALDELRHPVALTAEHNGHRRLTMSRSILDRARSVFWLVSGADKAPPLGRLLAGDLTIPAGLIRPSRSVVIADTRAARQA